MWSALRELLTSSGKATATQIDEVEGLTKAFEAFVDEALKTGDVLPSQVQPLREGGLPMLARSGDVDGLTGAMLLFLSDNDCVSLVTLEGLRARPELNGCTGRVCGPLQLESGRWPVRVLVDWKDDRVEHVKLRTANLRPTTAEKDMREMVRRMGAPKANFGHVPA